MKTPRPVPLLFAAIILCAVSAADAQSTYVSSTFTQGTASLSSPTGIFPSTYTQTTFTQGMTPLTSGTVLFDSATATYTGNNYKWVYPPSGFNFTYFGSTFTAMCVTTMGYIVLRNSASITSSNTAIPSTSGASCFVAPFWDNLAMYMGGGAKLWYQIQGAAPNRIFVFEYFKMNFNGQGTVYYCTAQVKLYESLHQIEICYDTSNQNWGTGIYSASIGIENGNGTVGIDATGSSPNNSSCPPTNYRYNYRSEDDNSVSINLPFAFRFFGISYATIHVSTNGFISFGSAGATTSANTAIPTSTAPNAYIALFWDDLVIASNGVTDAVRYQTLGSTPNRDFVIEYYYVTRSGQTSSEMTGQIHLYEGSNRIELQYATGGANSWSGVSATIGIEDSIGVSGFGGPNTTNTIATCPSVNYRYDPAFTLQVISANGSPNPVVGTHAYVPGASVTCSVSSPVSGGSGTQYACSGWTGTGSVSPTGLGTTTTFTMLQNSTITWNWNTQYQLTLNANPAAGGTVSHNQPSNWINSGTSVTISAVPNGGYQFTNWTGGQTSTSNPHTFTMSSAQTVTGNFSAAQVALVVGGNPAQYGTPSPAYGLNNFSYGSSITASVTSPVTGPTGTQYVCTGWTGTGDVPATGTGLSANFTLTQFSSIAWNWTTEYQLVLQASPMSGGSVSSNPPGPWIPAGTPVTVTATPGAQYIFANWSGPLTSSVNPDTFTMSAPCTVTGNFMPNGPTITVASGYGTPLPAVGVTGYLPGTPVTCSVSSPVNFSTGVRYVCTGWVGTGDIPASGSSDSVSVILYNDSTITWTWVVEYLLTASESPSGAGTVSSNPAGPWIASGTQVTLSATPGAGMQFLTWSGSMQSAENPAMFTMGQPMTVSGVFLGDAGLGVFAGTANPHNSLEIGTASAVPALQAVLRAGPADAVRVSTITVWVTGSSNETATVSGVRLYIDADGDGALGGTETQVGVLQTVSGNDGSATFSASPSILIPAGGTVTLLAVLDFNASPGDNFQAAILGPSDVAAILDSSSTAVTASGLPVSGGVKTVVASTSAGSLELSVGPGSPAWSYVGSGTTGVTALQFLARASSVENVTIASISLSATGDGDDATGITRAALYQDMDMDGLLGPGDLLLGEGTFTADDGTVAFGGLSVSLTAGAAPEAFLLVVDISGSALGDFRFGFANAADVSATGQSSLASLSAAGAPFWSAGIRAKTVDLEPTYFAGSCGGGTGTSPWLPLAVLGAALLLVRNLRRRTVKQTRMPTILVLGLLASLALTASAFGAETSNPRFSSFADLKGLLEECAPGRLMTSSEWIAILQDDGWGWEDETKPEEEKPAEDGGKGKESDGEGWGSGVEQSKPPGESRPRPVEEDTGWGEDRGPANWTKKIRIGLEVGGLLPMGSMKEPYSTGEFAGLYLGFGLPPVLGDLTPTSELRLVQGWTQSVGQEKGFDMTAILLGLRDDFLFHIMPKSSSFNLFFFIGAGVMVEMSSGTGVDEDTGQTEDVSGTYPFFLIDAGIGAWLSLGGPIDLVLRLEFDLIPASKNVSTFALGELGIQMKF